MEAEGQLEVLGEEKVASAQDVGGGERELLRAYLRCKG